MELLDLKCPRCQNDVQERFYGPCSSCRDDLATLGGEQREVAEVTYEPKMNVIPNQIATKE